MSLLNTDENTRRPPSWTSWRRREHSRRHSRAPEPPFGSPPPYPLSDHPPGAQAYQGPNPAPLPNSPAQTSSATPSAPHEPRTMRRTRSSAAPGRGGKMKARTYPELPASHDNAPQPQSRYQQAVLYINNVVKKTSDALPFMPEESLQRAPLEGGKHEPSTHLYTQPKFSRIVEPWSNAGFSHPRGTNPSTTTRGQELQNKTVAEASVATMSTEQIDSTEVTSDKTKQMTMEDDKPHAYPGDMDRQGNSKNCNSSSDRDLVEAMHGLSLFNSLRPRSDRSKPPPYQVPRASSKQREFERKQATYTKQVAVGNPAPASKTGDCVVESSSACRGTADPDKAEDHSKSERSLGFFEATENVPCAVTEAHSGAASPKILSGKFRKQTAQEAVPCSSPATILEEVVPVESGSASEPETYSYHEDLSEPLKQSIVTRIRQAMFENITPDKPCRASPTPSISSRKSDDSFEVIDVQKYQTRRNGLPGIWGRLVKGKKP